MTEYSWKEETKSALEYELQKQYLVITTKIPQWIWKRCSEKGKMGCALPQQGPSKTIRLLPSFPAPEPGHKELGDNARCTHRARRDLAAALSLLRGNNYLLIGDYYGNFSNSIEQHRSWQYSKSGCGRALRSSQAVKGEPYNARNFGLQYIFSSAYPI